MAKRTGLTIVDVWTVQMMKMVLQSHPPLSRCQRTTLPSLPPHYLLLHLHTAKCHMSESNFPLPEIQETRCPRLDSLFKSSSLVAEAKATDVELAHIQAFVLDPVGPLIRILKATEEDQTSEDPVSLDEGKTAIADALRLLGNTSAQTSRLRRKKIMKAVNPEIQDLADKDICLSCPRSFRPRLWRKNEGEGWVIEAAQCSLKATTIKEVFWGSRPTRPQRGGSQNRGGRHSWTRKDRQSLSKKWSLRTKNL